MKKNDLLKFRENSLVENKSKLASTLAKLTVLRVEFEAGNEKSPKEVLAKKKAVAQMMTIIREKEISNKEAKIEHKKTSKDNQ